MIGLLSFCLLIFFPFSSHPAYEDGYLELQVTNPAGHVVKGIEFTCAQGCATAPSDASAKVRGQIVDNKNRGITGVKVFVVGYDAEAMTTKEGGNFELPAHAAIDQQVLVHAEKTGYRGADRHHPAGDTTLKMTLGK